MLVLTGPLMQMPTFATCRKTCKRNVVAHNRGEGLIGTKFVRKLVRASIVSSHYSEDIYCKLPKVQLEFCFVQSTHVAAILNEFLPS